MKSYYRIGGFTLVEIMIVVVIIGLLAAMAIPAFAKVRATSRSKAVLNNLRQFAGAANSYMLDQGVTTCTYTDVIAADSDHYLLAIVPVVDEDYTTLSVVESQTQLTISGMSFGTVTFHN
jgi:type IV pilus assembly protein PilA